LAEGRTYQRRVETGGLEWPRRTAAAAKSKRSASVSGLLPEERQEREALAVGDPSPRLDREHPSVSG
jgi:hypothetical protein